MNEKSKNALIFVALLDDFTELDRGLSMTHAWRQGDCLENGQTPAAPALR
jgi:hypothetical protein